MRLLLFLAAALVGALSADEVEKYEGMPMTRYKLPASKLSNGKLEDGTIFTFYVQSVKSSTEKDWVDINFYDFQSVDVDEAYDITARIRIEQNSKNPVHMKTLVRLEWTKEENFDSYLDQLPSRGGMWRVDVYKHDKNRMSVFFQGYYSGTLKSERPLDNIKSVYILSDRLNHRSFEIPIYTPNENLEKRTYDSFWSIRDSPVETKLCSFAEFSKGVPIKMIALLRANKKDGDKKKPTAPSLVFKFASDTRTDGFFMKIEQTYEYVKKSARNEHDTHKLRVIYVNKDKTHNTTECIKTMPSGELKHLKLTRIDHREFGLLVFNQLAEFNETACQFEFDPVHNETEWNKPFEITGHDGALLLHVDTAMQRAAKNKREEL